MELEHSTSILGLRVGHFTPNSFLTFFILIFESRSLLILPSYFHHNTLLAISLWVDFCRLKIPRSNLYWRRCFLRKITIFLLLSRTRDPIFNSLLIVGVKMHFLYISDWFRQEEAPPCLSLIFPPFHIYAKLLNSQDILTVGRIFARDICMQGSF